MLDIKIRERATITRLVESVLAGEVFDNSLKVNPNGFQFNAKLALKGDEFGFEVTITLFREFSVPIRLPIVLSAYKVEVIFMPDYQPVTSSKVEVKPTVTVFV